MVGAKKPTSGLVSFTCLSSFNFANSWERSLRATFGLAWLGLLFSKFVKEFLIGVEAIEKVDLLI